MSLLNVENIRKSYGKTEVLKDISFSLKKGEVLAIIGSSGSGKTTLLRCLNFLETPGNGKISVNDKVLFDSNDSGKNSESQIRKNRLHFGLVFQSFNLFPQYSVIDNINERLFKANILVNEINNSYEKSNYALRTGDNSRIIER